MDTNQPILSPAQRARRCVLTMLLCFVVVAGVYAGFNSHLLPFKGSDFVVASANVIPGRDAASESATPTINSTENQPSAPIRVSMSGADSIAVVNLVVPAQP